MRLELSYTRIKALVWRSLWCRRILRRYFGGSLAGTINLVLGEVEIVLALS